MKNLETDRMILRQWFEEDSKDLYEYAKDEFVGPNCGWPPHKNEEESKEVIKRFIKNDDTLAIVLKSENKVIGSIGLHDRKPDVSFSSLKQKEIGYALNPKYWGQALVPEAVKCLIDYGFNELNLDLIWCGHYDFNHNSKRVNEKCGFNYRFQRKKNLELLDNKEVTILYYSILKSEFFNSIY